MAICFPQIVCPQILQEMKKYRTYCLTSNKAAKRRMNNSPISNKHKTMSTDEKKKDHYLVTVKILSGTYIVNLCTYTFCISTHTLFHNNLLSNITWLKIAAPT